MTWANAARAAPPPWARWPVSPQRLVIPRKPWFYVGFLLETGLSVIYGEKMKGWTFVLLLTVAAAAAGAEIFKWRLPDGSIEYSDRPPADGAERVELSPLVTYSPPAPPAPGAAPETEGGAVFRGYERFVITSPTNNAQIRENTGEITLTFAISPSLVDGHAIDIFMDGFKFGRSPAGAVTLTNVNRGTHQIYAKVVDETGVELARTGAITVHLQRAANVGTAIGGAKSPGGPQSPGGPASPGGAQSPGGPLSPGGPDPRFGATPTPPP